MTRCGWDERIGAYHDREMPPDERARVETHLTQCASCARELARLRNLSRLLASGRVTAAPPALLLRLHVRAGLGPEVTILRMARRLTAVAASVLVASLAWMAAGDSGGEELTVPSWEIVAVGPREAVDPAGPDLRLAQWIERDLSGDAAHD